MKEIIELAAKYDRMTVAQKLELINLIKTDVRSERDRLQKELNDLDKELGINSAGGTKAKGAPRMKMEEKEEAILKALAGGKALTVAEIVTATGIAQPQKAIESLKKKVVKTGEGVIGKPYTYALK